MATKRKTRRTKKTSNKLPFLLGTAVGCGLFYFQVWPHVVTAFTQYIGQIVITAVHQHWQWEQTQHESLIQSLMRPATDKEKL